MDKSNFGNSALNWVQNRYPVPKNQVFRFPATTFYLAHFGQRSNDRIPFYTANGPQIYCLSRKRGIFVIVIQVPEILALKKGSAAFFSILQHVQDHIWSE